MFKNRPLSHSETLVIGKEHELGIPPRDGLHRPILKLQDAEAIDRITGGFNTVIVNIAGCGPDDVMNHVPIEPDIEYYVATNWSC